MATKRITTKKNLEHLKRIRSRLFKIDDNKSKKGSATARTSGGLWVTWQWKYPIHPTTPQITEDEKTILSVAARKYRAVLKNNKITFTRHGKAYEATPVWGEKIVGDQFVLQLKLYLKPPPIKHPGSIDPPSPKQPPPPNQ